MAVGDLIKLIVNQAIFSQNVQNVLYYEVVTDDGTTDNEIALAEDFFTDVLPSWVSFVVENTIFTCIQTQKVFPLPVGATFDRIQTTVGTITTQGLPGTDAALIRKFNPAVAGVGRKGRVYVTGIPEAEQNQGRITAALQGSLNALATLLIQNRTTTGLGDYKPVWATRAPTTPFAITGSVDWTNFTSMPRIATQRRRRTPIVAFSPP